MNLNPGKIVRQVLGMMLAVQDTPATCWTHGPSWPLHTTPTSRTRSNRSRCTWRSSTPAWALPKRGAIRVDEPHRPGREQHRVLAGAFPPFLIFLTSGPKAPVEATRIDHWLEYPASRAFSKRDRKNRLPDCRPARIVVAKIYQDQQTLVEMGG
jgi:hypothetical protein